MYEERLYRNEVNSRDLNTYELIQEETDLLISSKIDIHDVALESIERHRRSIKAYAQKQPAFYYSLRPIDDIDTKGIIWDMIIASQKAGVGPMAGVAGAVSLYVAKELLKLTDEIIIENGGDIYIASNHDRKVMIYAGKSALSNKICLEIRAEDTPIGICTSSGRIGHSLSYGNADAVVILSEDIVLADTVATATGNIVKSKDDIDRGINFAKSIKGILGVIIIIDEKIGLWGDIKLTRP